MYKILKKHPELQPFESDFNLRMDRFKAKKKQLLKRGKKLIDFANGHEWYGFHKLPEGWV